MANEQDLPLVLVGFRATAKAEVGRLLAEHLGRTVLDVDAMIAETAGKPLRDVFLQGGEAEYARLEAQVLERALASRGTIVLVGGMAAERPGNLDAWLARARVIALSAVPSAGDSSTGAAPDILVERESFFGRAHVGVATAGKTTQQITREILAALG